ncbi:PH domain-containing protein [Methanosarcinaceae archaeon]|nr:PH domain-containing protein [Methanosarcinaceae archaeon]
MISVDKNNLFKLKKANDAVIDPAAADLIAEDEVIVGTYKMTGDYVIGEGDNDAAKVVRDYIVFTNRRFISAAILGLTGKTKDISFVSYRSAEAVSFETTEDLGVGLTLLVRFDGLGLVKFQFEKAEDVILIGKAIGSF